jgi:putative hemolysin
MDGDTWASIGLVFLFVLVGGVFAGTEFALVSLREAQIDTLAERGARGRRVASVARDPNRFLAAVQVGVTVAGFLSAAYGASTLAPDFAPLLVRLGLAEGVADTTALVLLTLVIASLSLVLGELVPKRIALQRSAQVALAVAPTLDRFATLVRPVIWLLSRSTDAVVRLLGGDPRARSEELSEAELRAMITSHEGMPADERRILADVLGAAERTVAEAMRPRGEVAFLPAELTLAEAAEHVRTLPHSRYPVTGEDFDDVLGFVHVRDVLQAPLGRDPSEVGVLDVVRPILELPATNRAIESMSLMRRAGTHLAIVVDEYGGTDGIVSLEDLVEELVGDIRDEYDRPAVVHAAGMFDAGLTIEEFARDSGVELEDGPYETVAGYVLARLGRLATAGDVVKLDDGRRLTVVDVADRRIRTVRVGAGEPAEQREPGAG